MINLEQVKLLETKVVKTIDFVERISKENAALVRREAELQEKLETYQKRIDELEVLIMGFKEEQGRIEDGILAALDRLSQFEEAIEKSLKEKPHSKPVKDTIKSHGHNLPQKKPAKEEVIPQTEDQDGQASANAAANADADNADPDIGAFNEKICFEIPDEETSDDIIDPLNETLDEEAGDGNSPAEGGELDIF
jgi:predicted nuclease with TOPRIM domain